MAAYTEHTLDLPDGIQLFYIDSGPVNNSTDYITLIILHGLVFNNYCFSDLCSLAFRYNLRIIACNRREYFGSTRYTNEELDELKQGSKSYIDKVALHDAWLIQHFIEKEGVPKPSSKDGKTGGIMLLGWSFGNASTMALFSDPNVIPSTVYEVIEPYLTTLILLEPTNRHFGYTPPNDLNPPPYHPANDKTVTTLDAYYDAAIPWLASYYEHPDANTAKFSDLDYQSKRTERCTIDSWSEEQKDKCMQPAATNRVDHIATNPEILPLVVKSTVNALFNEDLARTFFPHVKAIYITGRQTCWPFLFCFNEASRQYKEGISQGKKFRLVRFCLLPKGNHFLHYDHPELLLQAILQD